MTDIHFPATRILPENMKKERVRNAKIRTRSKKTGSASLVRSSKSALKSVPKNKSPKKKTPPSKKVKVEAVRSPRITKIVPAAIKRAKPQTVRQEIKGKTFFSPEQHPSHPYEEYSGQALPFSYNGTKLVLLPRDPEWAFGYWDFSGTTWNWIVSLGKADPGIRAVLRIHNMDAGGHYDMDVTLEAKNWYIHLNQPGSSFEAELGLIDSKGIFHSIVRSNRIRLPRSGPSSKIDPNWEPENFEDLYQWSGGGMPGGSSGSGLFSDFLIKKRKSS